MGEQLTHEQRFWFCASTLAFNAAKDGDWTLYERLKAWYVREFPEASPADYEAAMPRIARMARV